LTDAVYYSFDVGYCDDVTVTVFNTSKAEIFVGYTKYVGPNDFGWRATCGEEIFISHECPSYVKGTLYITVKCADSCASENFMILAKKEIGPRTITSTSLFTASGHVEPDTVDWYSSN
jgi:hypothetical protein